MYTLLKCPSDLRLHFVGSLRTNRKLQLIDPACCNVQGSRDGSQDEVCVVPEVLMFNSG